MRIGIIGAGSMGAGIAQVAASADCHVKIYDQSKEVCEKALIKLDKILSRLIEKGRIDDIKKKSIQDNISIISDIEDLKDSDLVIEAIIEDEKIKKNIFSNLSNLVSDKCVIATNTSSLSVTSLASSCNIPERFIGIHFFNPAPLMPLVEIIPALQTNQKLVDKVYDLISVWGKSPVIAKDTPGFIVNRIARPFYGEALRLYEEGIADFKTIDNSMKQFGGFKMGPFELMDFIGNDVNYAVTSTVFKAFYYDPRYKPSFTQKQYAEAKWLGRKTNKGYYDYSLDSQKEEIEIDSVLGNEIFNRILVMLINEAVDALYMGVASEEDIEIAMTKGVNYPLGLIEWGREKSFSWCVKMLDGYYEKYHEDRYRCSPLLRKWGSS
jgi:3-hydroxybutyryl-CoA dehydrogenase